MRLIKEFINKHHVLTLATSRNNIPYSANCFYVYYEDENMLVFTTDHKTKHAQDALKQNRVAGSIVLETNVVGKIQGVQFQGIMIEPQGDLLKRVKTRYLKRFPVAMLMKTNLWIIELSFLKFTDNRLGFGKKLIWGKRNHKIFCKMILVTGGTGLVGSHLLYDLVRQDKPVKAIIRDKKKIELVKKVFSYYSEDSEKLLQKIDWVEGDIIDLQCLDESFVDVKKVYHCAAIVSFNGKDKNDLINANVQGTENVVNLCLKNNVEKLCHVSSIASLGGVINGEFIDENNQWASSKNRSAYAVSKYKSEMEVWRGVQEGLNAVIVNPSVILGPGFWNTSSGSLFTKAAKGMNYYTTGATGFIDVRDVSKSMIELMDSDINAERFVLNAENIYYKDLFNKIADAMNVAKPKKKASVKLLKLAVFIDSVAGILKIKKREITKEIIKSSTSVSKYSNKKIKKMIGKTFIPIEKSIGEIAEKFKNELTIS